MSEKQKIRNKVDEMEKKQKERVQRYQESKMNEARHKKSSEVNSFLNRASQKEKELMELAKLED